jgi:alkylated DNA repair dioxygenase AlkB
MLPLPAERRLDLPDADVYFWPTWLPLVEAEALFARLRAATAWEQPVYTYQGQAVPMPRQVAWHADAGVRYGYSGVEHAIAPWSADLDRLRAGLTATLGEAFNSVLLNHYRDGRDSVAWHADNERELGPTPLIASVSLGATRTFAFKPRGGGPNRKFDLPSGSLLVMAGATQRHWVHQVPKTTRPVGPRINLTFRQVLGRR